LDEFVAAFRGRLLDHAQFPCVCLDAAYSRVWEAGFGQVVSEVAVAGAGVRADGGREVLGLDVGGSGGQPFWEAFPASLRVRGLSGVRLVVFGRHVGLAAAFGGRLRGAARRRCRVDFARKLSVLFPKTREGMAAAALRAVFA
jgi:putative transposase